MTDDQLNKEYKAIVSEWDHRNKIKQEETANSLCINGITCKDISVRYTDDEDGEYFSFYIKHDEKLYDIYYDHSIYDKNFKSKFHSWWPINTEAVDDWDQNGVFAFIPPGFAEAMENCYEYDGNIDQAIDQLKKYGITDVKKM